MPILWKDNKTCQVFGGKIWSGKKGISIIEILIVVAIVTIALVSLLGVAAFSLKISTQIRENTQANVIAQEAMEAVRNFRDGTDWNVDGLGILTSDTDYFPQKSGSPPKWMLVQGTETAEGFTRKVVFANVIRDTNDNIVGTGGTNDPNTKKVTVTVYWKDKEVKLVTYLTNWK